MKKFMYILSAKFIYYLCSAITNFVLLCNFNYVFYKKYAPNVTFALQTNSVLFAKANESCVLYKTQSMSDSISNVYFFVPSTYFVSIISKINDSIYRVQYENFVGFVSTESIDIVSFVPSTPKPNNITFDISQKSGTQIWSLPSDNSGNILTTISADTKNIEYIASTTGDIPIGGNSNIWFYARYTPASNSTSVYEGYVYSEATTNLSHIPNNLEYEPAELTTQDKPIEIDNTTQVLMIILICLPFLILFVLACYKMAIAIKEHKQKNKKFIFQEEKEKISVVPKQFVRKKHNENSAEIIFPEYNYIDDDDLL